MTSKSLIRCLRTGTSSIQECHHCSALTRSDFEQAGSALPPSAKSRLALFLSAPRSTPRKLGQARSSVLCFVQHCCRTPYNLLGTYYRHIRFFQCCGSFQLRVNALSEHVVSKHENNLPLCDIEN